MAKAKVGVQMGWLDDEDMLRLNQAALVFLVMAISPRAKRVGWGVAYALQFRHG